MPNHCFDERYERLFMLPPKKRRRYHYFDEIMLMPMAITPFV